MNVVAQTHAQCTVHLPKSTHFADTVIILHTYKCKILKLWYKKIKTEQYKIFIFVAYFTDLSSLYYIKNICDHMAQSYR